MNVKIDIIGEGLKAVDTMSLSQIVFGCEYGMEDPVKRFRPIHEVIRWQMNKSRGPIQSIKNRSQVSGAHRKLWGQKESGRARQGDGKACHFRGGGACFSVSNRNYEFKLNKKYKKLAMRIALSHKIAHGGLVVLDSIQNHELSRTKLAKEFLEKLTKSKRVLLVTKEKDIKGIKNIPYTDLISPEGLNLLSMSDRFLIFDRDSISTIERRFANE